MPAVVYGPVVGEWVAKQSGGAFSPSTAKAIGIAKEGYITAGCFFENYNGASMVAHLAINGRITREFLWCLADYAFRQCKVRKLIAPVDSANTRMVHLAWRMGFLQEGCIQGATPQGDILIFTMTPATCRFLGEKYNGQAKRPAFA